MAFTLTITQQPTHLHAIVTGENSVESVRGYLKQIRRECRSRGCFRVLVEERLEGPRLNIVDVFRIASEGSARALGQIHTIACVDVNAEGDLMKFAEHVAVNRFLRVAVFSSVENAELWLHHMPVHGTTA
jgi:hypothetical protein